MARGIRWTRLQNATALGLPGSRLADGGGTAAGNKSIYYDRSSSSDCRGGGRVPGRSTRARLSADFVGLCRRQWFHQLHQAEVTPSPTMHTFFIAVSHFCSGFTTVESKYATLFCRQMALSDKHCLLFVFYWICYDVLLRFNVVEITCWAGQWVRSVVFV